MTDEYKNTRSTDNTEVGRNIRNNTYLLQIIALDRPNI